MKEWIVTVNKSSKPEQVDRVVSEAGGEVCDRQPLDFGNEMGYYVRGNDASAERMRQDAIVREVYPNSKQQPF
ncbi:MAG: hypothetical protein AAFU85_04990 [Planctomycetota bacterium]